MSSSIPLSESLSSRPPPEQISLQIRPSADAMNYVRQFMDPSTGTLALINVKVFQEIGSFGPSCDRRCGTRIENGLEWTPDSSSPFIRTKKVLLSNVPGLIRTTLVELCLGIGLMAASVILTLTDFVVAPVAAIIMCVARFAIYWVWAQTKHSFEITVRLFPEAKTVAITLDEAEAQAGSR